jgi:hypothetical protein
MAAGAVPVTQQESLPLLTVQQFLAHDNADTIVFGNTVLKYWASTTLWPDAVGHAGEGALPIRLGAATHKTQLTTGVGMGPGGTDAWLDLTPCKFFSFVIKRTFAGAIAADAGPMLVSVQYKQTPTETPPYDSGNVFSTADDTFMGIWDLLATANAPTWPLAAAGGSQRYTLLISPNSAGFSRVQNVALCMGPYVRFQLNWAGAAPAAAAYFSMSIWGSS